MNDFPEFYPVKLEADYPERSSRLLALCGIFIMWPKMILAVPHIFILYFVNIAAFFIAYIGFWVVLFTGSYPRGMHSFVVGTMRWQTRVQAWMLGLVDEYPPFSTR